VERHRAGLILRIVVAGVLLALLVPKMRFGSIEWDAATFGWLLAGMLVTLIGLGISAVRWKRVLDALGIRARLRRLFSLCLAGQFLNNILPSTVGGDVLRVTRLSNDTGDSPASFASVVLERLSGWLVLPVLTLTGLLVNPGLRHVEGPAVALALGLTLGTLLLLAAVLFLAGHPRVGGRFAEHESWLGFLGAVHLGLERLRRRPLAIVSVLVVGFVYQVTVVLAAFLAAQALDIGVSFTALLTFFPAVAIAQVVPISVGGIGLREGALVIFLANTHLGASHTQAVALGLAFFVMNVAVGLLGAPSFAMGRRPARALV
jgi:uncharacterized membrane protein YbhN (UPF0104 family)